MRITYLLLLFILVSCSCSEELPNYSKEEMLGFAYKADKNMQIKVGTIDKTLVDCKDYTPRCRTGFRVVLKGIKFNALLYNTKVEALEGAKRIRGYVARNWVFDEVRGEPVLERLIVKHLKAKPAF